MKKIRFMFLTPFSSTNSPQEVVKGDSSIDVNGYLDGSGAKVFLFSNKDNIIYKFIVVGETEYGEYGYDIVASALSILTINTANSLKALTDAEINVVQKRLNELPYIEVELDRFKNDLEKQKASVLIDSFSLGVQQIEEQYGKEFVEIIKIRDK